MTRSLPSRCAVYGAGSFGRELARDLSASGVDVVAVLDRKATGSVGELAIAHPDSIEEPGELPIVIGIFNTGVDVRPIADELLDAGFPSVLGPVAARLALAERGFNRDNYWLDGDVDLYRREAGAIATVRRLLRDDLSRQLLDAIISYRVTGEFDDVLTPGLMERQYNPPDLPFITGPVRFLDCGACDGDTIRAFGRTGVQLVDLVALEPDPANFSKLVDTVEAAGLRATLMPLGAYDRTCQLRFSPSGAAGTFADDGEVLVQCVALDDLLHDCDITHVKMDIEGAELAALRGMKRIGAQPGLRLALSIYHRPADLWQIPLLVEQQWPGRSMHIRQHGNQGFDTVLYVMES